LLHESFSVKVSSAAFEARGVCAVARVVLKRQNRTARGLAPSASGVPCCRTRPTRRMSAHKFQEGNTMHHAGSTLWVLCAFLFGAPVHAADEPRLLRDIADRVDPAALHSTIAT